MDTITISTARLAALEAAEQRLAAIDAAKAIRLERLNARNKSDPTAVTSRTKKHIAQNRDAYNARRRELRRLKKEAAAAATVSPGDGATVAVQPPV